MNMQYGGLSACSVGKECKSVCVRLLYVEPRQHGDRLMSRATLMKH